MMLPHRAISNMGAGEELSWFSQDVSHGREAVGIKVEFSDTAVVWRVVQARRCWDGWNRIETAQGAPSAWAGHDLANLDSRQNDLRRRLISNSDVRLAERQTASPASAGPSTSGHTHVEGLKTSLACPHLPPAILGLPAALANMCCCSRQWSCGCLFSCGQEPGRVPSC